ncbi:MAG: efflux RND transporter periplasmic adaptor subunit [Clostridiales bacterium]
MANGNKKKTKKKIIIFSGAGLVLVILGLLVVFSGNKEQITSVQTETVQRRNITQKVSATGKINPEYKVVITPEVTGEIVELPVKEGDVVKKGQLLIKIKPDSYIAARDRAEANLESAKAGLARSKAVLDRVKSEYERAQGLYNKKLASDADLEQAKSNFLSSKSDYESQVATVQQFKAALKETNESLYKTTIYSPMNGTISQLNVELGERVLGSGFSQGTNIMTVADLSQMEADVEVDENDVVLISVGDTAKIEVDAFPNREFKGVVYQIGNSAKTTAEGTQQEVVNFEIKIRISDPEKAIRPGMSCNADILTETKNNVLSVPIQSVTARGSMQQAPAEGKEGGAEGVTQVKNEAKKDKKPKEVVFIAENNKAKMKEVKTGISDDNYIEVMSGLGEGAKVISGPYRAISRELNDNANIRLDSGKKGTKENDKQDK